MGEYFPDLIPILFSRSVNSEKEPLVNQANPQQRGEKRMDGLLPTDCALGGDPCQGKYDELQI
jgi:hypothetical protein